MALTGANYLAQLQALLPVGAAWSREPDAALTALLQALADEFARADLRADQLIIEADPRSALELISDWERVTGLPDSCSGTLATTLQERREAVVAKLTAIGGASRAYFTSVAERLGYTVEIDEYRPFISGLSRCGDLLNGGHPVRHTWRVRVTGPRYTAFRTGVSQCGDLLGEIDRADDLECTLQRLKPAHTTLIVSYEGA